MDFPWEYFKLYSVNDAIKYSNDILIYFTNSRKFFLAFFTKNDKAIFKQSIFYIVLFIVVSMIVHGMNTVVVKNIIYAFFYQLLLDFTPILISVFLTYKIFRLNFIFKQNFTKIIIFLLLTYLFFGSIVLIAELLLTNTEHYKRDYFIYSIIVILYFIQKHIRSSRIFFTEKKHIISFMIINFFAMNIMLITSVLTSIDFTNQVSQQVIIAKKLNIFNDKLLQERVEMSKASGTVDGRFFPWAKIVVISNGKAHNLYSFNEDLQIRDTSTFVSNDYNQTIALLRTSKKYMDTLSRSLKDLKFHQNVDYFKLKLDLYESIINGINVNEIDREIWDNKNLSPEKIYIERTYEIITTVNALVKKKDNFSNDTKIALFPILSFFKIYFVIAHYTINIISPNPIEDYGYYK